MEALGGKVYVVGLDISETVLRYGHSENPELPLSLGDAVNLPFKEEIFDAVFIISGLEHMQRTSPVLKEVRRVLKDGGILYLCLHKEYLDPFL